MARSSADAAGDPGCGFGEAVLAPAEPTTLSATSVLLFLRSCARPDPGSPPATYRLELDDRVWTVRTEAGGVEVLPEEPAGADACLRTTPKTLSALVGDPAALEAAIDDGDVTATGDLPALRRLLRAAARP